MGARICERSSSGREEIKKKEQPYSLLHERALVAFANRWGATPAVGLGKSGRAEHGCTTPIHQNPGTG
jgi:hypothetical protein